MLTAPTDILVSAEQLQQALDRPAPADVANALASLEQALRRHTTAATAPDGLFAQVDQTRPTLVRRMQQIQHDLFDLADQTAELKSRVGRESLPPIGLRAAELVGAVRRLSDQEADLFLETVNMDLGAGD
jgi:hypothetical protein